MLPKKRGIVIWKLISSCWAEEMSFEKCCRERELTERLIKFLNLSEFSLLSRHGVETRSFQSHASVASYQGSRSCAFFWRECSSLLYRWSKSYGWKQKQKNECTVPCLQYLFTFFPHMTFSLHRFTDSINEDKWNLHQSSVNALKTHHVITSEIQVFVKCNIINFCITPRMQGVYLQLCIILFTLPSNIVFTTLLMSEWKYLSLRCFICYKMWFHAHFKLLVLFSCVHSYYRLTHALFPLLKFFSSGYGVYFQPVYLILPLCPLVNLTRSKLFMKDENL